MIRILIAFLAVVCLSLAAPVHQTVTELRDKTFWDFIDEHKDSRIFVKFYAPWCGHCKKLAPTWDEIATTNEEPSILYAKVDCTTSKTTCKSFNVASFPTLKLLSPSEGMMGEHVGGRDAAILQFSAKSIVPRTPMPSRAPPPTMLDNLEEVLQGLQRDLLDVWNYRKNIMGLIFVFGFSLGYCINFLANGCGAVKHAPSKMEKIN